MMPLATILGLVLLVFLSPLKSLACAFLTQENPPAQPSSSQPGQQPSATEPPNTIETKKAGSAATPSPATPRRKPTPSSSGSPSKKVVRDGSTADPGAQLAPAAQGQGSQQVQNTTQLLANVDDNLKKISSRRLNQNQLDSVKQIRLYMDQAKTAEAAGDLDRAHNLAVKAHLLSDDLVRH
jgi:hypothetical protein